MRLWMMFCIGALLGAGFGVLFAASQGLTLDGHDHATGHGTAHSASQHAGHKGHTPMVIAASDTAPTLMAQVKKDAKQGWNLHVTTTNFRFAPDRVNSPHQDGEGHAHVYINGKKIARLYGPWLHIPTLPKGKVDVTVELNANDHSPLQVGDNLLRQVITVTVE